MEIFLYREGAEQVEEGISVNQLPELLKESNVVIWVDMEKPSLEDDQILLDVFHFHPLTVEDSRGTRHHPKIDEFPDYIYFIFHGVRADTSSERFNTIELDGYLGKNFIVTYHHEMFRSINLVKQKVRSSPVACQRGATFLFHQILDQIVDFYMPVMEDFDEAINDLEDDIFSMKIKGNVVLEEILLLKRNVLRLRRISLKQQEVLLRMSRGEITLIDQQMLPFFRDIYDHLVRITDLAENYRDLLSGTLDAYLSVVSNRMNEIMKVLTIFSAIMLPLTFIAGVYGMNFDNMPELHSRYGYFAVVVIMFLVAIGMLFYFRRKGWIGTTSETENNNEKNES
jgi:magnesium transporter